MSRPPHADGARGHGLDAVLHAAAAALPVHSGFCVALSGGRDSAALLDALHRAGMVPLRAVHVHHALHPDADRWAAHCQALCAARGVACLVRRVTVVADGDGPEAAARKARYAEFAAVLRPSEVLVTAHHAGDQAETVLFRILRGAGPTGAAGMLPLRRFATGWLWRPLLTQPRAAVEAHVRAHDIEYVDDPGNSDGTNTRSRLRPQMGALERGVPGAERSLVRFAALVRQERDALVQLVDPLLDAAMDDGWLPIDALQRHAQPLRNILLRRYCARLGLPLPGPVWLEEAGRTVLCAAADAQPRLRIGSCTLRRYRGWLCFLRPLAAVPEGWQAAWRQPCVTLPGDAGTVRASGPLPDDVTVRFLRPGERHRLAGRQRSQPAKHLFQQAGVPPWERERTPLIEIAGAAVQLGNWRLHGPTVAAGAVSMHWEAPSWHCRETAPAGPLGAEEGAGDVIE